MLITMSIFALAGALIVVWGIMQWQDWRDEPSTRHPMRMGLGSVILSVGVFGLLDQYHVPLTVIWYGALICIGIAVIVRTRVHRDI